MCMVSARFAGEVGQLNQLTLLWPPAKYRIYCGSQYRTVTTKQRKAETNKYYEMTLLVAQREDNSVNKRPINSLTVKVLIVEQITFYVHIIANYFCYHFLR